jgi:hypothetical protein
VNEGGWRAAWAALEKADLAGGPSMEATKEKLLKDKPKGIDVMAAADVVVDDSVPESEGKDVGDAISELMGKYEDLNARLSSIEDAIYGMQADSIASEMV